MHASNKKPDFTRGSCNRMSTRTGQLSIKNRIPQELHRPSLCARSRIRRLARLSFFAPPRTWSLRRQKLKWHVQEIDVKKLPNVLRKLICFPGYIPRCINEED
mmetsp:Transcript_21646/g.37993  ORF Transcript_21646/g.37993 Transcript_21646/m.37993 type:complete len:103 (+) Transcript_21646:31-339(+)